MATFAMTDVTTWVHSHDFTTDLNQASVKLSADELDKTTFGGGSYKARAGGLKDVAVTLGGFWDSATPDSVDPVAFAALGVADRVMTMTPTGVEGSTAYLTQLGQFKYDLFDQVGAMTPFSLDASGTNKYGMVRGQVASTKRTLSATGPVGSAVNLGAASASQFVYAALHVFSAGTTITVTVESASDSAFTTPHTVGSLGPVTTTGGVWMPRVAGPVTDIYYRFKVAAITGSFSLAGAIGIQ